jgi:hypothetical protein
MRSGVVEATLDDYHYLACFDELIGLPDGSKWPDALAAVEPTWSGQGPRLRMRSGRCLP